MLSERNKLLFGIFMVCGICLSGGFATAYYFSQQELESGSSITPTREVQQQPDSIEVHDQVAIDDVLVDSVTVSAPSFVVVHSNVDDKPGDVLGVSSLISSSPTKNVVITLDTKLNPGQKYFVLVHKDNGDGIHTFPGGDTIVTTHENKPLISSFTALAP